ncbi:MAG TPA: APC family permease [Solirubrobacteraceae bacterium]|jgi:amino acid transporter|nr:APC family permease [Solirubrobacteraceae bacterium]
MSTAEQTVSGVQQSGRGGGALKRNAVGLTGAVIMSTAIMGPAVSTFFNPQFSTPFSGEATPFVYGACLLAILLTASGIIEMAAEYPSAGAFYTYVTRSLGAQAGFVTGALMFVAYALLPPAEIGLIGSFLQSTFRTEFSANIPWWIIGMVPAGLMIFLGFEGIRTSLRMALILFSLEVCVVFLLAVLVLAHGGKHGITLHPFDPGASPQGFHGLVVGWVFAALSFVGFEGATTLGHEVREPKRIIPRAVIVGTLFVGLLYVFCVWAETVGLGPRATNALTGASTPWPTLATMYASWMKWPVIIASVSSMFAVMINSANGIARILNTMGSEGLLPKSMGHIDAKRNTPSQAVFFTGAFSIIVALIVGAVSGGLGDPAGGSNVYGYLGFLLTLGILPVYVLTNLAAAVHFWRAGRFSLIRHGILPVAGGGLMVALLVGQILENSSSPYDKFPIVILGWVVVAAGIAVWLGVVRPNVLKSAGSVLATGGIEEAKNTEAFAEA